MTDITEARRQLISIRTEHGADSPIGSRASMAIEQLQNAEKAETPELRESILAAAMATLTELHAIKKGAPADTQVRPQDRNQQRGEV